MNCWDFNGISFRAPSEVGFFSFSLAKIVFKSYNFISSYLRKKKDSMPESPIQKGGLMIRGIGRMLCVILISFIACGCTAIIGGVAGGLGTATWLSGKLGDELNASYEKTIEAAEKSLKSLKMEIEKETKKDDIAQIISEHKDLPVWIDIRPITSSKTKVEVRVGVTGNMEKSREILDAIKKNI